jgi:hypothetical protein
VSHDHLNEFSEQVSLQWLREEVRQHLLGWAVLLYFNVPQPQSVFYEEVPNVDVPGVGSTWLVPVFLKPDRTLVVLVEDVLL